MSDELPRYGAGVRGLFRYDHVNKKLIRIDKPKPATVASPYVHQDTIDPIESMATQDREMFDSKSAYRRHLKEHGFVESYGHTPKAEPVDKEKYRKELRETAEKAFYDLKYDRIPLSEKEKELCKQEQRKYQDWKKRNSLN